MLQSDSRQVKAGDIFAAVRGLTVDGYDYIDAAMQNGAAFVITDRPTAAPHILVAKDTPLWQIARAFYANPSRELTMLGVTGTNGKTTVAHIVHETLTALGHKTGLIGTNRIRIGTDDYPAERTTPDALSLQKLFREMVDSGCTHCVMEVSSHALEQDRVGGIVYQSAAFTNLTPDHLDFHKTMENYFDAKLKLRAVSQKFAACTDGEYGGRFAADTEFSVNDAESVEYRPDGVSFTLDGERITWRTPGRFSVENALCAAALLKNIGITTREFASVIAKIPPVVGRMEPVPFSEEGRFTVLIDYAHTPDALENILKTARAFTKNRLTVLFGCGGDRDRSKRALMGDIAARLADRVIITSDNPRSEDPDAILDEIEAGQPDRFTRVSDRRAAIKHAVETAQSGDVIILAGKGQETYQEIGGVKHHMDEREILRDLRDSV